MYRRCCFLARRARADAAAPPGQAEYKSVQQRLTELEAWASATKDFTDDQFMNSYMKIAEQAMAEDPEVKALFDKNSSELLETHEPFSMTIDNALKAANPRADPKELKAATPVTRALVEIFQSQLSSPRPGPNASALELDRWWETQSAELREIWDPFLFRTLLPAQVDTAFDSLQRSFARLDVTAAQALPQSSPQELARKWAAMSAISRTSLQALAVHYGFVNNIQGMMSFVVAVHRVLLVHPDLRAKQDATMNTMIRRVFGATAARPLRDDEWDAAQAAVTESLGGKYDVDADELAIARAVCDALAPFGHSPLQAYIAYQMSVNRRISPAVAAQNYATLVRRRAMEAWIKRHQDPSGSREYVDFFNRWEKIFKSRSNASVPTQ